MRIREFEFYDAGWRPVWAPHFDAGLGTTVAHDTMEHGPADKGTVEDELMALGTMWHLRGTTGYLSNTLTECPLSVTGKEIYQLVHDVLRNDSNSRGQVLLIKPYGRSQRLGPWAEEELESCLDVADERIAEEIRLGDEGNGERWRENYRRMWTERFDYSANRKDIAAWLRAGFRRSVRTYPDPVRASHDAFQHIATTVDRFTKESFDDNRECPRVQEGDRLKITVCAKRSRAWVRYRRAFDFRYQLVA